MEVEGLVFLFVGVVPPTLCYIAVMVCVCCSQCYCCMEEKCKKKLQLYNASQHLIRAGEAFEDAGTQVPGTNEHQESDNAEAFEQQKQSELQKKIGIIILYETALVQNDYEKDKDVHEHEKNVYLLTAERALKMAGSECAQNQWELFGCSKGHNNEYGHIMEPLEERIKMAVKKYYSTKQDKFSTVIQLLLDDVYRKDFIYKLNLETGACTSKICKFVTKVQSRLLIVYLFVFCHSVKEVAFPVPSPKGEHVMRQLQGYLFGGYRCPKKPIWMHTYFLTMLLIVAMWFSLIFWDTFLYRKTTTCNDIDVRNDAYLCFDINKSFSAGAVTCTDPAVMNNPNIYVICYLSNFNITVALSLSFSFMQLVILLIHISFSLTLWCVKNCSPKAAIGLYGTLLFVYAVVVVSITSIFAKDKSLKDKGINFFYGLRVLRVAMVILGIISPFCVTLLSPYYWLIDKNSRKYYPSHYNTQIK